MYPKKAFVADKQQSTPELSLVFPCLNEERTLPFCLNEAHEVLEKLGIDAEIVVADNGSTDRSVAIAEQNGARVVHERRRGYGNALRAGFDAARGTYVVMADCDGSYDLSSLPAFVAQLRSGSELVMGNRFRGRIDSNAMPWLHRYLGNPALTWILNRLFGPQIGDAHCGLRAFRRDALPRMNLRMTGMELASEMIVKSSLVGLRISEVPVHLRKDLRDRRPHLRTWRDGWRHLRFMLLCSPLYLFVVPGIVVTLAGVSAAPFAVLLGYGELASRFGANFMYTASLLSLLGAQFASLGLLAKFYAHIVDPAFRDQAMERFVRWFSFEFGIFSGIVFVGAAVVLGAPILIDQIATSHVRSVARWVSAVTLGGVGLQITFTTCLLGVFSMLRPTSSLPESSNEVQ